MCRKRMRVCVERECVCAERLSVCAKEDAYVLSTSVPFFLCLFLSRLISSFSVSLSPSLFHEIFIPLQNLETKLSKMCKKVLGKKNYNKNEPTTRLLGSFLVS